MGVNGLLVKVELWAKVNAGLVNAEVRGQYPAGVDVEVVDPEPIGIGLAVAVAMLGQIGPVSTSINVGALDLYLRNDGAGMLIEDIVRALLWWQLDNTKAAK